MYESARRRMAIVDVLRTLGLIEEVDYRVKTVFSNDGVPIGTLVNLYGDIVRDVVIRNADSIEKRSAFRRAPFHVSVRYPYSDRPVAPDVDIKDFGTRVRETPRAAL